MNLRLPLALAIVLGTSSVAVAQTAGPSFLDAAVPTILDVGESVLDAVHASPAQRRALLNIGRDAARELRPHDKAVRAWARDVESAFVAPEVNRAEAEALRTRGLDLADDVTAVTLDSVVDAASVLTAAQRQHIVRITKAEVRRLL